MAGSFPHGDTPRLVQALFDASTVAMAVIDDQLRYVRINDAFAALGGRPVGEYLGRLVSEVERPLAALALADIRRVLKTGEPLIDREIALEIPHLPGTSRVLTASYAPLPTGLGAVGVVVTDITDRSNAALALAESESLLDTIIESSPEGFALFDGDLRFVRVNEALAQINGIPREAHIGKTLEEIVPDVPREGHLEPLRQVLTTGEPIIDLEVTGETRARPGSRRTWLVSYYPVRRKAGVAALGATVIDITERRRIEEQQALLNLIGEALERSLSLEERLEWLARLAVPAIADACLIDLLGSEGRLRRVAVSHVDPVHEQTLRTLGGHRVDSPAARVTETGEPLLYEEIPDDAYRRSSHDRTEEALRRSLEIQSWIVVPLTAHGRHIGTLTFFTGRKQSGRRYDSSDLRLAQEVAFRAALAIDNAALYESERAARLVAETAASRLARLQELTAALSVAVTPDRVAAVSVEYVASMIRADAAWLGLLGEQEDSLDLLHVVGLDTAAQERLTAISAPLVRAIQHERCLWYSNADELAREIPQYAALHPGMEAAGLLPLTFAGVTLGGLGITWTKPRELDVLERELLLSTARLSAQALARALRYQSERTVALTLQRSLLPLRLPPLERVPLAVRYLSAADETEAGGDWYEAIALPAGRVGLAVGDVVGRGAPAAAAMGQLRSALRAYALDGADPARVLTQLSRFADEVDGGQVATVIYAVIDPARNSLTYASAGHLPPLVVHANGSSTFLEGGRGLPLAAQCDSEYEQETVALQPGDCLLLYSDGAVERRGEALDEGLQRMRSAANQTDPEGLLEAILVELAGDRSEDDVALLAAQLLAPAAAI